MSPYFKPLANLLLVIIRLIEIGDLFNLENLISDFKLLPVPEINTAVFILFVPVDRTI
jgi:hypothetical protein